MKPSFDDIQVFFEVTESRSFTAAAERLGRTKSAVSQAVSRLETDLGKRLLRRTTRSLSLTDAGTRLLAHCRELRNAYDAVVNDMSAESNPSGTLSLTAPDALSGSVIAPVIADYVERFPAMAVRLHSSDFPADLVGSQIDLALRVGEPKTLSARVSKLGTLREYLYASPRLIKAQSGLPQTLADLDSWPHIANDWQGTPVRYNTPDGQTLRVAPRIRCNSFNEVLRLVELGAGVARLPMIGIADRASNNLLESLFDVGSTPVYAMHQFAHRPPAKVVRFVEMTRSRMKESIQAE